MKVLTREELLGRISINPNICFGKPCIRGHRIWVSLILDLLAGGASFAEVLADYPGLEEAERRAVIAAAEVPIPLDPKLIRLRQDAEQSKTQLANRRLTSAQDLAWALINTPAFLFNR